jgi:large subunit ribosomal protein L35
MSGGTFRPYRRPSRAQRDEEKMPKQKTKRAAMKRFKRTGTGKLKRWHANHSHILTKKTRKRKNRLKKGDLVSSADFPRVSRLLQA